MANTERCLICHGKISGQTTSCSRCDARYHQDCWNYNSKCARYGCGNLPAAQKAAPAVPNIQDICTQCQGTERIACERCETENCVECFEKMRVVRCRGCDEFINLPVKPTGSMLCLQMMETARESLIPIDPMLARIFSAIGLMVIAPVALRYLPLFTSSVILYGICQLYQSLYKKCGEVIRVVEEQCQRICDDSNKS